MLVRNAAKTKQEKKSFEVQLDKAQIKDLKEHIKSLKRLKKEISAPIAISDNVVAELWMDDAYIDAVPTLRPEEIDIYPWMSIDRIRKASKDSKTSAVEDILIFMWEYANLYDTFELLELDLFDTEIKRRLGLVRNICKSFNVLHLNAAGLSKKEGEDFLDELFNLTFKESEVFIEGVLKGNRMIVG